MDMADYIEDNLETILQEWEEFAGEQHPSAVGLSRKELRNLGEGLLRSAVGDMRAAQSEGQRHEKSRGAHPLSLPTDVMETARGHAADRLTQGFTLNQLIAEYRALRASVTRRWRAQIQDIDEAELEQLIRFNEAVDASLTEAVGWYNARLADARDLLNGVLAHDLRSPLSAILTSAEVLLRDEALAAPQTRAALRIRNSAIRMRSIISDLLDFTRTRLGTRLPTAMSDTDMESLVGTVVEEQRAFNPESAIRGTTTGDLSGRWDSSRIEQVLSNLIANAIEHGGDAPVTVAADGRDHEVTVNIHNKGGTISKEEQRVIFDPLRRAAVRHGREKPAGRGMGLGLYIARQIVEAHDGTIEVDSSPQAGTTFRIRLPRQPQEVSDTAGLT